MKRLMVLMMVLFCMCGNAWGLSGERSGLVYYPTDGASLVAIHNAVKARGLPAHYKITHSGSGVSTPYIIASGVTFEDYETLESENGAMLVPTSGATVRPYRPTNMVSSPSQQIYDVSLGGAILYQETGTEYPERFGGFNGGTDITTEVSAMATALDIDPADISDGGVMQFGAGLYRFNLEIPDRQSIYGVGKDTVFSPAIDDAVVKINPLESTTDIVLQDFKIVGETGFITQQDGIRLQVTSSGKFCNIAQINNVIVEDCGRHGVYLSGNAAGDSFIQGVSFDRLQSSDNIGSGLYMEGDILETVFNLPKIQRNGSDTIPNAFIGLNGSARAHRVTFIGGWINNGGTYSETGTAIELQSPEQVLFKGTDFEESLYMVDINNALSRNVSFETCKFSSTGYVEAAIKIDNLDGLLVDNCSFASGVSMNYGVFSNSADTAISGFEISDNNVFSNVDRAVSYRENKTISNGAINLFRRYMQVDTEAAAASDSLDYIYDYNSGVSNLKTGDLVIITALNGTHTVNIPHLSGNISTSTGVTVALDDIYDSFMAVWSHTKQIWIQTN